MFSSKRKSDRGTLSLHECKTPLPGDVPWYPELTELQPEDFHLLHWLRAQVGDALGQDEIVSDLDVLHLALQELLYALRSPAREDKVLRLLFRLSSGEKNLKLDV